MKALLALPLVIGMAAAVSLAVAATARDPVAPKVVKADHPGRVIFERQCAPCHGAGPGDDGAPALPATMRLAAKYEGELPGALELRGDLDADIIRLFVRQGSGGMPSFRKSELSDPDIDLIAGYIQATARASTQQ